MLFRSSRHLLMVVAAAVSALPSGGAAQTDNPHVSAGGLSYLITPPSGYGPESDAPPVLLFLHGGDRSNTRHHPARYATEEQLDFPFLVVAPHCTGGCTWPGVDIRALLAEVAEEYRFDHSRVYLTGYSMGGYGAWSIVAQYPDLFAAAAPIAGGGDPDQVCAARGVPVRAYHGDQDNVIQHSQSVLMVDALNKCDGDADLVTLPGVDHGSWIPTFKDPAFYNWLLSHRRTG